MKNKKDRVKELKAEYKCKDWDAILLYEFEELINDFSKFMENICGINLLDDKSDYKIEASLDDFINGTMTLEKRIVNICSIIKTEYPTASTHYISLMNEIRSRIKELNTAGERMTLGRLLKDIKLIQFEFISAIQSQNPELILGLTEFTYRDDEKLYKGALKSLGHKNFEGVLVLQALMKAGGKYMRAKDIAEQEGIAESTATKGMNSLIDNCMEILIAGFVEGSRALAIPSMYLRFKQVSK